MLFLSLLWNAFAGEVYFIRPDSGTGHFYKEIGLEVAFRTTLQNYKPQMPSTVTIWQVQIT